MRDNLFYHRIPTHMTMSEKEKLFQLTQELPTQPCIVEIGSYLGASSSFLAMGLKQFSKGGILHCVDTWNNDAMDNIPQKDVYNEFVSNICELVDVIQAHRGYSQDIAATCESSINMIFFDGNHSYEGTLRDWLSWKKYLSVGAVVVFHDWGWAEGVKKVILDEVHPNVSMFDTLPNMWWGYYKGD